MWSFAQDKNIALIYASAKGNKADVERLLGKGADINARLKHPAALGKVLYTQTAGWTALMMASYLRNTEIVKLLLNRGADVDAKGPTGKTALMIAVEEDHYDIVELLRQHRAKEPDSDFLLIQAARIGNKASVERLLAEGADVNAERSIAIILASGKGYPEIGTGFFSTKALI